ncbi:MAG: NAD(P)H-binding protein [Burkholderiales bacterium]
MEKQAARRVALLAGATGLVGREILAALLADDTYAAVHSVGRRALATANPKLTHHVLDFAALPALPASDDVFIALGTTIKTAGSQSAFRAVDFDAVLALAAAARASGASRLGIVSAMGASEKSLLFYNRVKGEMEHAVSGLGYPTVVFARPSMLIGNRGALGQTERSGEKLALMFMRFGALIPANYRAIEAVRVARALVHAVNTAEKGTHVLLSGDMQAS